jgi:hypothetical protein
MAPLDTTTMSYLDTILSDDPVLSAVAGLFPEPLGASNSIRAQEQPPVRPGGPREPKPGRIPARLHRPEMSGAAAAVTLMTCVSLGIILNSAVIALVGVAVTLCLGVVCHVEIRRRRRPDSSR